MSETSYNNLSSVFDEIQKLRLSTKAITYTFEKKIRFDQNKGYLLGKQNCITL